MASLWPGGRVGRATSADKIYIFTPEFGVDVKFGVAGWTAEESLRVRNVWRK